MMQAVEEGNEQVLALLLEDGCDPSARVGDVRILFYPLYLFWTNRIMSALLCMKLPEWDSIHVSSF